MPQTQEKESDGLRGLAGCLPDMATAQCPGPNILEFEFSIHQNQNSKISHHCKNAKSNCSPKVLKLLFRNDFRLISKVLTKVIPPTAHQSVWTDKVALL